MATKTKKNSVMIESTVVQDEYQALICVWILRTLLSSASAFKGFFQKKRGFMDSDLLEFLQLSDENESDLSVSEVRTAFRSMLSSYEKQISASTMLFSNIGLMAGRINLTAMQQQILALVVLKNCYEPLKDCFERVHTPSESHLYAGMARLMDVDVQSITKAMAGKAALRASGVVKIDENYRSGLEIEPRDGI